jgi:hypothetical protein
VTGEYLLEVWFRPLAWDGFSTGTFDLLTIDPGGEPLVLRKPGERPGELHVVAGGTIVTTFPVYNWVEQDWMGSDERHRWHCLNLAVTGDGASLTLDGFPGLEPGPVRVGDTLRSLTFTGGPGTAFAWPFVRRNTAFTRDEIWSRFCRLYAGENPDLTGNLVTLPFLTEPPRIDGQFRAAEWSGAARLTGFSAIRGGGLLREPVEAYMGFDTHHLYLAVVTPHTGNVTARHWGERDMPLWDEESYEVFLGPAGSAAAELIQLIGNPYGDQTDFRYGSLAWRGDWLWAARLDEQTWSGELKAAFMGIEAPLPKAGESWYLNLYNTRANAAWSPARGSYRSLDNMGTMQFDRLAPAIRPGHVSLAGGTFAVPMEIRGVETARTFDLALELYRPEGRLPVKRMQTSVGVAPGTAERVDLALDITDLPAGRLTLSVRDGERLLFFHSVLYPAAHGRER